MLVRQADLAPIDFDGLKIFDYTANSKLRPSLAIIEVASGSKHAEAWSKRSDKYYLVIGGQIQFTLDDKEFILAAGDFCYVEQGNHFSYRNDAAEPATLVLVHTPGFDPDAEIFAE